MAQVFSLGFINIALTCAYGKSILLQLLQNRSQVAIMGCHVRSVDRKSEQKCQGKRLDSDRRNISIQKFQRWKFRNISFINLQQFWMRNISQPCAVKYVCSLSLRSFRSLCAAGFLLQFCHPGDRPVNIIWIKNILICDEKK